MTVPSLLLRLVGVGVVLVGVVVGCSSSSGSTCSTSEESSCTNTYDACIQQAAQAADKVACSKCVDDYCACYDKCGNTCDRSKLSTSCQ